MYLVQHAQYSRIGPHLVPSARSTHTRAQGYLIRHHQRPHDPAASLICIFNQLRFAGPVRLRYPSRFGFYAGLLFSTMSPAHDADRRRSTRPGEQKSFSQAPSQVMLMFHGSRRFYK